ncbi:hypothetical protein DOK76_00305 [Vagococcus sp. DIV0080]|uniref:Uncharacterized protein n=1 Tax=Candidatus Vagococcus giribetii TaxID=2230876 RepID=A0ABS3HP14_9ENTE|nr:hypothetical protein [Vagococcus sp. DIV0080]MBO0475486.1 hypothetical protein [Vagococcus sp. DIV0080]
MGPQLILIILGSMLIIVGGIRMTANKSDDNLLQLILSGQASGIGQLISGIICLIIVAVIVCFN